MDVKEGMTKLYYLFLFVSLFSGLHVTAQSASDSLTVDIEMRWQSEKLELHTNYSSATDTLQIQTFKFYMSDLEIYYDSGLIYKEKNRYHLIDVENAKSLQVNIPKYSSPIHKVKFSLGVDSTASVSGAMSGDLDVTNGMYWAWQSGYINMKIEGQSKSCHTRKNAFQFHIGGYLKPNDALRKIEIDVASNNKIKIVVDASKLFENIELSKINSVMIPGLKAIEVADLSTKMFSIE